MGSMTTTMNLTIGETLRLMRERAGFSQTQLAKYLEMGRTSVIRYEADTALPKWKDVEAWARICDHDPSILRDSWVAASMSGCSYGSPPPDYDQLSLPVGTSGSGDRGRPTPTLAAV